MGHNELTNNFVRFLRTNIPPSDAESKRFRDLIQAEEAKYQIIAANVEALSEQHQAIQDRIQAFKNVVSPARRLPPETVADIFCLAVAFEEEIVPDPLTVPLLLTQICSGWRQVALHTPKLWTDLFFHVQADTITRDHLLARAWIERCRHHTFSMKIQSLLTRPDPFVEFLVIRPEMLSALELDIPHGALTFLEKLPSSVEFSNLRSLRIVPGDPQDSNLGENWLLWPEPIRVFESLPKLECLSIEVPAEDFNPVSLHLPWHQLKDLRLNSPQHNGRIPDDNMRSLLRKCTLLESCMVALDTLPIDMGQDGVIVLPHLEFLAVSITLPNGTIFFESMELPKLKNLSIATGLPPFQALVGLSIELHPLFRLQQASKFALEKLALLNMLVDQEELVEVLRTIPSLTKLSLVFVWPLDDGFFSALEDDSETALLPRLSTLSTDFASIPSPNLQAILKSRGYADEASTTGTNPPRVSKLERLALLIADSNTFDDDTFENFEKKGLKLTVQFIDQPATPEPE